ncbi:MAG: TerB family tellurite resistance protein [Azoarcus sp.]|nr:TerB family tellurite resistance protein [Azoarcus sp.]MDD2873500.1 TerB family tellurite resistance protein [Azoarcus sp.]MDX9839129.1 TerB family tellurite resistance protein [Azoarcus sp.]
MKIPLNEQRAIAARLVALTLISDGELANREVEALDRHEIAALLGIPRDELIQAVIDHCQQLLARGGNAEATRVLDLEQVEHMLDRVTDPSLRALTCQAMLVLSKADGRISQPEQTLLRHALSRWDLSLDELGPLR